MVEVPKKRSDNPTEFPEQATVTDTPEKKVRTEIVHKPEKGTLFVPNGETVSLGREQNHLGMQDGNIGVSKEHASLSVGQNGTVTVLDMDSTNGTFVEGRSAKIKHLQVNHGYVIFLGSQALVAEKKPDGVLLTRKQVEYDEKNQILTIPKINRMSVTIGTEAQTIGFRSQGLSRKHARLSVGADGKLLVEDLNSTNGVYIDDEQISAGSPVPFGKGEALRFGHNNVVEVQVFPESFKLIKVAEIESED